MRELARTLHWTTWDGVVTETLHVGFESGGWTADGLLDAPEPIHYAVRLDEHWRVRQLLVFRDLDDPDLWLGHDGGGRWGEINGAHRPDLDGCVDIELSCTPFTRSLPVRRLKLPVGGQAEVLVARIDVDTLGVEPVLRRYTRVDEQRWEVREPGRDGLLAFEVDEDGYILDEPDRYRRVPAPR